MSQVAGLQLNITGYGQPAYANTAEYSFATSPLSVQKAYAFATGFQTISKPTGASGVRISNLSASGTLTIKGITGDTGLAVTAAQLALFPLCIPLTGDLTVTATAGATADLEWL